MKSRIAVLLTAGILVLAGCGDDDGGSEATTPATSAPGSAPAGAEASIEIADFTFPDETRVATGASVAITNNDGNTHTVTADDGAFNVEVPSGETVELTAPSAGTYPFHCNIHGRMTATLVVE